MLSIRADSGGAGVSGALPYNPLDYCLLAACTAVAWVSVIHVINSNPVAKIPQAFAIELNLVVILTFHRRSGIYFWSLLISSWGCVLHALGFILKFLVGTSWLVDLTFIEIGSYCSHSCWSLSRDSKLTSWLGWIAMVSGQAFVLWSRLNLVVRSQVILRSVLAIIIIDGFALHTPTLVFIYGANSPSGRWTGRFNTMERIQLLGFSLQETIIGAIYIVATVKLLGAVYYAHTRRAMLRLLVVNLICIAMDAVLIGCEFSNNYVAEASMKPFIYAVKLKLEFAVYSQLVGFTKATFEDQGEFVDSASIQEPQPIYNSPADFFQNIPKVLRKPIAPTHPTIHTHPEQLLKIDRAPIDKEWDSSQIELSPSNMAAALTATGGKGATIASKESRDHIGHAPTPDHGASVMNRLKYRNADRRSMNSSRGSVNGFAMEQSHEP